MHLWRRKQHGALSRANDDVEQALGERRDARDVRAVQLGAARVRGADSVEALPEVPVVLGLVVVVGLWGSYSLYSFDCIKQPQISAINCITSAQK